MARQLGHGFPLGAFRHLGSWVQRRSLGTSSLSILDLKTFYPRGFPAVEGSANEPQPSTSADNIVARKSDISSPTLDTQVLSDKKASDLVLDTQILSNKRTPDPALDTQISSSKRTSDPISRKQSTPFRASLQRYFNPETGAATADVSLSQKGGTNSSALTNRVKPDLANPSTPNLQSASAETTISNPASEPATNISSTELSFSQATEPLKTSGDSALQRSATEEIQTDERDSSQSSVADTTNSIQSLQISPSTLQANAIHSELQKTTDTKPSIVEPNPSISAQRSALASTDINQSIKSLREPSASLQRSTGQHKEQRLEQPSELRTVEPKASPTSPNFETQTDQQPKTATPSVQRLNESTETPPSLPSPNQNLAPTSTPDQEQPLQRQPDSTTAAIPTHQATSGPIQQGTEQNATQPPNSETAAIPTHPAIPTSDSVQRATEQKAAPSSFHQRNTHARNHAASNPSTTVSNHLDVSPKIQTALESSQIASSSTSSNSNTVQQQLHSASKDSANDHPSPLVNNLPQVQRTSSQQHISQPSGTDLTKTINDDPTVTNSAESVQRVAESTQSPILDSHPPAPSSVSAQNLDSIQPVSDATVQSAVELSQASPPLVSEPSSAIQRAPDQSNITSEQLFDDDNDNPIQSTTHEDIQSVATPSTSSSEQINLSADSQRALETTSTPAQSKPTSDNLKHLQRQPNVAAGDTANTENSLSINPRLELPQPNATGPTLDSGIEALDSTDPPDVSSELTASVQRSTAEFKDDRDSAEQPISQAQADHNAIAPPPNKASQTSAHTENRRSPKLNDTAISPTEIQRSLSPPTDQSPLATESITVEPSNVQSVANSVESIQRTADSTQSSKLIADDTIQIDITQPAADNLSETPIAENPSHSQPVTSSAEPIQRVAELHQSTLSTSNPNQLKETQKPAITSNVNEEGTLATAFFETSSLQRLPNKAGKQLSSSESSSTEQASIVQRATTPANTHSGSFPENQSSSEAQPLPAASSESTSITQEHRSDSSITPDSIQRLSGSTALSPPAVPEKTPRQKTSPEPLAASRPSIQPKAVPDGSPVKLDKIQTSADSSSPIHNHGLSDSSSVPKQPSSLSVTNQTLELQQTSSVPTESSIAAPNPPNTLQRHTKSPQSADSPSADIPEVPAEATAAVSNDQNTTALSETLSTEIGESVTTTPNSSNALQCQTDTLQSADVPPAQTESVTHISGDQEAIEQSKVTPHLTRDLPATSASSSQSESLQRQTAAPISKPTSHTSTPSEIQHAPEPNGLDHPLSSETQHSFSTIDSMTESDQPASQPLTIQKAAAPGKDTSTTPTQPTSEPQPWSPKTELSPTDSSKTSIQRVATESRQTDVIETGKAQPCESKPGQTAVDNIQRISDVRKTDFSKPNNESTVESSQLSKHELSNSNLSEAKPPQLTSSDSSDIQRAVSSDSRSYQENPSDVLTSSPELTQPTNTKREPSDLGNEISTQSSTSPLQRSSNITSDSIDAAIRFPGPDSKIPSDSAATQRLTDETIAPPRSSVHPSKTRQQEHISSVTSNPETTNQEVSNFVVQRTSHTPITDSNPPLGEPLSNKTQLSQTDAHSLPAAGPITATEVFSVQRSSRQETSSYPATQTQNSGDEETHRSQYSRTQEAANRYSVSEKSLQPLTAPTETHSADIPETSASSSQTESLQRQTEASVSRPVSQNSTLPEIQQAPDPNGLDHPLSSDVQRSLSNIAPVTDSDQPASRTLTTQKAAALSKNTSTASAKSQSTSEPQPWSSDTEVPPTTPSTASIQRVAIESPQTDAIQTGEAQPFESQLGQTALDNIQRISDLRKTDFSKVNNESTVKPSQLVKNELSDSNLAAAKPSQLISSDSSDIQRSVSSDSRSYQENQNSDSSDIQRSVSSDSRSYKGSPSDVLTSSPDPAQPTDTRRVQPSNPGNDISAQSSASPLQRSSNITSDSIEATIHLPGSKSSSDTAATERLSDNVSDTIGSKKLSDSLGQPSKTLQHKQSSCSRESATSDSETINQEVASSVVQRSPNTPIVDSNLSLDEPIPNKAQLSHIKTHSLTATNSLQPITDDVSVQRVSQGSSRQEASNSSDPPPQNSRNEETHRSKHLGTQEAATRHSVFEKPLQPLTASTEAHPAPVSEPVPALSTKSSPHINSPSTSIQRNSLAVRQPQSSGSETSFQRSSNEDIQPESTVSAGRSLSHQSLGSSASTLPRVLQPLGVLKPLPSLQTAKSVPTPSVSPRTQPNTVQRQAISNEWTKNISSKEATSYPNPHSVNSKESSDTNPTAANIQQSLTHTQESIQRHNKPDNIPSEWSNLEDLVTHLQSTPSEQISTKTAPTQQPPNAKTSTAKVAPPPEPQTVILPKPATVQRQITSQPATKPTVIQACKDTSSDADSANTDEQTDENHNYSQYLELLAQEVYGLLRQRLSLEQERRGPKYPR